MSKKRHNGRVKVSTTANTDSQAAGGLTAIEDLASALTASTSSPAGTATAAVVVHRQPPTPSTPTATHAHSGLLFGSPEPVLYEDSGFLSPHASPHHHAHDLPEPTIGERFGRRHGQNWPAPSPTLEASSFFGNIGGVTGSSGGGRCASCPGSRSESRSKSRGGTRQTSGVYYKVIPVKPVTGHQVFQAARKTEEEIRAMKRKPVQEYYRSLNELLDSFAEVEAILKEHREDELAKTQMLPQLHLSRTHDSLFSAISKSDTQQSISSYGSMSGTTASANNVLAPAPLAPGDIAVNMPSMGLLGKTTYEEDNGTSSSDLDNDLEEGTPLIEYKRRSRTSPHLVSLAINISFLANIFLVILKIWTVLLSDSLAVLASMIDSLMDLLSGAIIWYSARLRNNTSDRHHYPVGKARMEPLGIIVFASVMVTSFLQVMLQSFERLVEGSNMPPVDLGLIILSLLALNILMKFALWAWCRTMRDSSSVQALAQDHLNDVVFNVFSTLFPVAGQYLGFWWLDAVGAILLSVYIITEWTGTCLHNIRRLTGQAATAADIQQLTYMTYRFSNTIQVIDTVRAYYVGDGLFAEVDIVLPPDTPLSQAHDLGESLQSALERLDSVERAFVHIDYNAEHAIEHR